MNTYKEIVDMAVVPESNPYENPMFRDGVVEGFLVCAFHMRLGMGDCSATTADGKFKKFSEMTWQEFNDWFGGEAQRHISENSDEGVAEFKRSAASISGESL
jgi:hypothetical protein